MHKPIRGNPLVREHYATPMTSPEKDEGPAGVSSCGASMIHDAKIHQRSPRMRPSCSTFSFMG